jgi:phosphohistidine phosphatase
MKALLIRHAAAIPRGTPGVLDDERPLTAAGEIKFRAAARGLARIAPRPDVLLTSPLPRAQATAEIAARAFKRMEPKVEPALAGQSLDGIFAALTTHPRDATVALVGHEPTLGTLLARMLGSAQAERLAFKKGGAALVDLPDGPAAPGRLIWFLDPRVLRVLADGSGITRKIPSANGRGLREEKSS